MTKVNQIAIASDHGGFELKGKIIERLEEVGYEMVDMGTTSAESVDYPDFGIAVANAISLKEYDKGILICGTGVGMSITANKFPGIRAALVHDHYTAVMSRKHNNANVLVLGGRTTGTAVALNIVEAWMDAEYEGGRHDWRIGKIAALDKFRSNKKK